MPSTASCSFRPPSPSPSRVRPPIDAPIGPARYGRMLPELPAFEADESFLRALGGVGGLCDCGEVTDVPSSLSSVAAGWPIFGQFVAHDITADRSALQSHVNSDALRNARAPQLNLECLYGDGPVGHPFLYQRNDPAKFLLGSEEADLLRNAEGIAIIGDPRNDSHMLMAQMHLAFQKAHNAFVDEARARGVAAHDAFAVAARELRWNYQSIIIDEFLPALIGRPLADEVLAEGPRWFRPTDGVFVPLEFADAAYRYGHSQIRQQYTLNRHSDAVAIFPDLLGFRPVPRERRIDWTLLFDRPGAETAQRAKKIDGKLPGPLIRLPVAITGDTEVDEYHSLAVRDLLRGRGVGLPSGEAVARHFGVVPLTGDEVGLRATGWNGETPLWYYILREAAVTASGDRLGPVGGRIVAEVFVTLLDRDPASLRFADAGWKRRRSLLDVLAPTAASIGRP